MSTILIVDDQPVNREFLMALLSNGGHRLLEAADGAEALRLLRAERPDLVITDILMPTMDGFDFAVQVRPDSDPALAKTRIIFYSATYNMREAQALAQAAGVAYVIAKPAAPQVILDTVNAALSLAPAMPVKLNTPMQTDPIQVIAGQLAEMVGELDIQGRRLAALVELMVRLTLEREPEQLLDTACDAARAIVGSQYALIATLADSRETLRHFVTSGMDAETIARIGALPTGQGVLGKLLAEGKPLRLHDMALHPDWVGLPPGHPPMRSFLGVPILTPAGLYGWLYLTEKTGAAEFSDEDERVAVALAAQVAVAYENSLRYDEIQSHAARLQLEITQRKQAEAELVDSEERFRSWVENAMDLITVVDMKAIIHYESPSVQRLLGYAPSELVGHSALDFIHPDDRGRLLDLFQENESGPATRMPSELRLRDREGAWRDFEAIGSAIRDQQGRLMGLIHSRDISERKRAEAALAQSNDLLSRAEQIGDIGSWSRDVDTGRAAWSDGLYHIFGLEPHACIPTYEAYLERLHPDDRERVRVTIEAAFRQQGTFRFESRVVLPDGRIRFLESRGDVLLDEQGHAVRLVGIAIDITERKQREREIEAIAAVIVALRIANSRAQMLPIILEQVTALLNADAAALAMSDPATDELVVALGQGEMADLAGRRLPAGAGIGGQAMTTGQPYVTDDIAKDPHFYQLKWLSQARAAACVPLITRQQVLGVLWAKRAAPFADVDVRVLGTIAGIAASAIQRTALYEQTEQRLRRLAALREIDSVIMNSLDLPTTLAILLGQVTGQLGVDAGDILLLSRGMNVLEYAAGHGFHSNAIEQSRLRLGEGHAGQAALERRLVAEPDLRANPSLFRRAALLAEESFAATFCVPLIAKGQVVGVLEVFHRTPLQPDADWLGFLETLAGQAAIAVADAWLFNDLQRSNTDMLLAYDTTLEGWSAALDLRDKETEGHSQRVTEMTLQLARTLGVNAGELEQMRRGALLHDIGKMGVPDAILFKPGKLTDDEWVVMRQHPRLAYELLSPIAYLRPALDIPYCHHEKWDGTGYPRQLKGEAIPLSARIFAAVDVWDALCSDRPYRSGWPEDQVRDYIRDQSGNHFDPKVVEAFLALIGND